MFGLGPLELAIIAFIIIIIFGAKKLPELGSGIGKAISNFKKSYKEAEAIDITPKEGKEEKNSDNSEKKE